MRPSDEVVRSRRRFCALSHSPLGVAAVVVAVAVVVADVADVADEAVVADEVVVSRPFQ